MRSVEETADGIGKRLICEYGIIFWTPNTGAHELHGPIWQRYASLGYETSHLGYPTTDELYSGFGKYNIFQNGEIHWNNLSGFKANELHGSILRKWTDVKLLLCCPVSEETQYTTEKTKGHLVNFENGQIAYSENIDAEVSFFTQPIFNNIRRRLYGSFELYILDEETYGPAERKTVSGEFDIVVSNLRANTLFASINKLGGEIRFEITCEADIQYNGNAIVNVYTKLLEGTSENTNDLDGNQSSSILVRPERDERIVFFSWNSREDPVRVHSLLVDPSPYKYSTMGQNSRYLHFEGDYAKITLHVSNRAI